MTAPASYITESELYALGLPRKGLRDVSSQDILVAIEGASRLVDSYLSKIYMLPLLTWGTEIKSATAKLAAYELMTTRGFAGSSGADDPLRLGYEDKIRWLELVSKGVVRPALTVTTDARQPPASISTATFVKNATSSDECAGGSFWSPPSGRGW